MRIVEQKDWPAAQVSCLADQGFEAQAIPDGIEMVSEPPRDQLEALNVAAFTCAMSYPVDPRTQEQLDEAGARTLYAHLVDVALPCIEGLGHHVEEPPTEDVWLATYRDSWGSQWDPFNIGAWLSVEEFDQVVETCPRVPDGLYPPVPEP